MVRPKKYEGGAKHNSTSFYIPPNFRKTWEQITKLSEIDNNDGFNAYIRDVEGEDIKNTRIQGKRGLYVRWILTKHVILRLRKEKSEGENKFSNLEES